MADTDDSRALSERRRDFRAVCEARQALIVPGAGTPLSSRADLADMGYAMVLYANTPLQAAMRAMSEVLRALRKDGDVSAVVDRPADFEERQRLAAKGGYDALDGRGQNALMP